MTQMTVVKANTIRIITKIWTENIRAQGLTWAYSEMIVTRLLTNREFLHLSQVQLNLTDYIERKVFIMDAKQTSDLNYLFVLIRKGLWNNFIIYYESHSILMKMHQMRYQNSATDALYDIRIQINSIKIHLPHIDRWSCPLKIKSNKKRFSFRISLCFQFILLELLCN